MARLNVRLFGLDKSELVPQEITTKLAEFRQGLVAPLVADFIATEPQGGNWPKSNRRKTIQQQTKGVIRGEQVIIGTFHSRYARSLDTGQTVEPRKKQVMRFRGKDGQFVFTRKPITHAPRPYFGRVLEQVPTIVRRVFETVFRA